MAGELSVNFRLTPQHIQCKGPDRQNVALATQLLSHTTAVALRQYQSANPVALRLTKFISVVNDWFDVMNSRNLYENQDSKKPFGLNIVQQNKILDEMFKMVETMRCAHSPDMLPFQDGILVSIKSTQLLFRDMVEMYGVSFLLTKKINQDALENFFGQVKIVTI